MSHEPLITYLTTEDGPTRDAAFLRTYAARVRDRTAAGWEIPNSVASTLEDMAQRIEARAEQAEASLAALRTERDEAMRLLDMALDVLRGVGVEYQFLRKASAIAKAEERP